MYFQPQNLCGTSTAPRKPPRRNMSISPIRGTAGGSIKTTNSSGATKVHYNTMSFTKRENKVIKKVINAVQICSTRADMSAHDLSAQGTCRLRGTCPLRDLSAQGTCPLRGLVRSGDLSSQETCPLRTCPLRTCPLRTCPLRTCPLRTCQLRTCPLRTCRLRIVLLRLFSQNI
jgi:hypothetical protein